MKTDFFKERILITGATGFIGFNLLKRLLDHKANIFALSAEDKKIKGVQSRKIDLADFKKIKAFVDEIKPTVVFHLGALVNLSRDFEAAQKCVDSNIKGTLNLLEAVKDHQLRRFLFLSTEEIYGDNPLPYQEDQLPKPPSPYAVSKVAGENFCLFYHQLYNLPATVFRINTIYGPHQPESRFIPNIIIKAIRNDAIDFNSGTNRRDYLFVDDLIEAIMLSIDNKNISGQVINIGTGKSITGRDLVMNILKNTKSSSKINFNAFSDREGEAPEWRIDANKAKSILGWEYKTLLDEGLKKTINYYRGEKNAGI